MVDEFKKQLMNYLLGKLPQEKGKEEEIFNSVNEISRDDWIDFIPDNWNNFRFEGLIEVNNTDKIVVYGGYKTADDEVRGIIMILNNDFKPIKTFYQYDSGTYLRYIQRMIQEEDGEFIAIDCPDYPLEENWSFTTSQKRFLMFNNFASNITGDYILSLQRSYIFSNDYANFYCRQIFKNPDSSQYVMVGNYLRDQNAPDFDGVRVIELKVNVGTSNEWKKWDDNGQGWHFGTSYIEFDNDNFFAELLLAQNFYNNRSVGIWKKDFTQSGFTYSTFLTLDYMPTIDTTFFVNQAIFLNKNEVYFVINNQHWGIYGAPNSKYIGLYHSNLQTSQTTTIYEHYLGDYEFTNKEAIYIYLNDNDLYIEFNDNIDGENHKADYYIQRLINDKWNPILLGKDKFFQYNQRSIYIKNDYNLLNIYLYPINPRLQSWQLYNIKENYNRSNYNGHSYIDKNIFNSNDIELYSNDLLVFARNLYNKTINQNTTISSFEIPSGYLNDRIVEVKNLLSKTKFKMIADTKTFEKNVYETIYLNFITSFLVADKNNPNRIINNQSASVLINNSINNEGYENTYLYPKVIINYQDNSVEELLYSKKRLGDTKVRFTFSLNPKKEVRSAEFVSNDKETVYQTIDLVELEVGKFYAIKQDMEVL